MTDLPGSVTPGGCEFQTRPPLPNCTCGVQSSARADRRQTHKLSLVSGYSKSVQFGELGKKPCLSKKGKKGKKAMGRTISVVAMGPGCPLAYTHASIRTDGSLGDERSPSVSA